MFAGAAAQADLVRHGTVSAIELTEATLDRIAAINPTVNAYREVFAERALSDAADLDKANRADVARLPLGGVPVAVKDTIDVEGSVTTYGTAAVERPASGDAPIVAALRAAGAVIIGKTTCSELARLTRSAR